MWRQVGGHSFESEMTAAKKNGHLGLQGVVVQFADGVTTQALTYPTSVLADAYGTLEYNETGVLFTGGASLFSLAGSGSNNLDDRVGIESVGLNYQYCVERGPGRWGNWIPIVGGGSHPGALLWDPPASLAKRKNAYKAAQWADGATTAQGIYDKITTQKSGITYDPSGWAQGDNILLDDPGGYNFTPSNPSRCEYLAAFLNMLARDYHGVQGGTITSWWGGTEDLEYRNLRAPVGCTVMYTAGGSRWYFVYHTMAH